jgi:23S rRNA (uracil1939-C5)-methyltransferase
MAVLTVSGNADFALKKEEIDRFIKALNPYIPENGRLSIFLRIVHAKRGMATETYEMHLAGPDHIFEELEVAGKTYRFKISPASFFQPNTYQAERLFAAAFELVGKAGCVLDLYSGTGVLGVIAGQFADKVMGIELCPDAVLDARENGERNGVKNVTFLQGRVEEKLSSIKEAIDLVMCDPPRAGLDARAIDELIRIGAPKILYISCNPQTQKTNVDRLLEAGYHIQAVQPVDQFPRTVHIENIVVLVK